MTQSNQPNMRTGQHDEDLLTWGERGAALWQLLDDIDSAGDEAKGDDAAFRRWVGSLANQRHDYASTDGYDLTWLPLPECTSCGLAIKRGHSLAGDLYWVHCVVAEAWDHEATRVLDTTVDDESDEPGDEVPA